mmetsp:Transcript_50781/g.115478  ORF Transcript_50781/g.115478 Transcript_50781/m.115478 type:complete len:646 (-) Transcript_50781:29-1966(-)
MLGEIFDFQHSAPRFGFGSALVVPGSLEDAGVLVVVGGSDSSTNLHDDLLVCSTILDPGAASSWKRLFPSFPPKPRRSFSFTPLNPRGSRILLLGGQAAPSWGAYTPRGFPAFTADAAVDALSDAWILTLFQDETPPAAEEEGSDDGSDSSGEVEIFFSANARLNVIAPKAAQNGKQPTSLEGVLKAMGKCKMAWEITPDNPTAIPTEEVTKEWAPSWKRPQVFGYTPQGRWGHSCSWCGAEREEETIVFGGVTTNGEVLGDLHRLEILTDPNDKLEEAVWNVLHEGGPARGNHCAGFHPRSETLFVFGGHGPSSTRGYPEMYNDVWSWTLNVSQDWYEVKPAGTIPVPRFSADSLFSKDWLLVAGGSGLDGSGEIVQLLDCFSFDAETLTWTAIDSSFAPNWVSGGMAWSAQLNRGMSVCFGGETKGVVLTETAEMLSEHKRREKKRAEAQEQVKQKAMKAKRKAEKEARKEDRRLRKLEREKAEQAAKAKRQQEVQQYMKDQEAKRLVEQREAAERARREAEEREAMKANRRGGGFNLPSLDKDGNVKSGKRRTERKSTLPAGPTSSSMDNRGSVFGSPGSDLAEVRGPHRLHGAAATTRTPGSWVQARRAVNSDRPPSLPAGDTCAARVAALRDAFFGHHTQ